MPLTKEGLIKAMLVPVNDFTKSEDPITEDSVPAELEAFCTGFIAWLKASRFSHTPGNIKATAPPAPGPVQDLELKDGKITLPANFGLAKVALKMLEINQGKSLPKVDEQLEDLLSYIADNARFNFPKGSAKGASTAAPGAPPVPGTLVGGFAATGGKLSGLSAEAWVKSISFEGQVNIEYSEKVYQAIIDYLVDNISVTHAVGTIQGTFTAPGAKLVGIAANFGIIN